MAVLLADEIRRNNAVPVIYGLLPEIAEEFGFDRTESIDDLIDSSDLVVFGGGGAFLRSAAKEFHDEIERVCHLCESRNVPVIMISVGGDGGHAEGIPEARLRALRQAQFISFRNPEDVNLQTEVSGHSVFLPDIVWTATRRLEVAPKHPSHPAIAIDETLLERKTLRVFLHGLISLCRIFRPSFRFQFFSSAHSFVERPTKIMTSYQGIRTFTEFLSSCSLVITPRLHAGLVAISQEIPVMLLAPHGKASLLFRRHGLERYVYRGKLQALALAWKILGSRDFEWCREDFQTARFEETIRQAEENYSFLKIQMERYCSHEKGKEDVRVPLNPNSP